MPTGWNELLQPFAQTIDGRVRKAFAKIVFFQGRFAFQRGIEIECVDVKSAVIPNDGTLEMNPGQTELRPLSPGVWISI